MPFDQIRYESTFEGIEEWGNFGKVSRITAKDNLLKFHVSIKKCPLTEKGFQAFSGMLNALLLLDLARSPHIEILTDIGILEEALWVVKQNYQFNLQDFIFSPKYVKLPLHGRIMIMFQLLKALEYVHSMDIVHRNVNLASVHLDSSLDVKLSGFHFAKYIVENNCNTNEICFNPESFPSKDFLAPEILRCDSSIGPPCDMWSAGCIFASLFSRKSIFQGISPDDNISETLARIDDILSGTVFSGLLNDVGAVCPLAAEVIRATLTPSISSRMTAKQCVAHPLFKACKTVPSKVNKAFVDAWYSVTDEVRVEVMSSLQKLNALNDCYLNNPSAFNESESITFIVEEISKLRQRLDERSLLASQSPSIDRMGSGLSDGTVTDTESRSSCTCSPSERTCEI